MPEYSVGLGDLSLHIPSPRLDLNVLLTQRVAEDPTVERRLRRAITSTGQIAVRFPEPWEDTATLAAQSLWRMTRYPSPPDLANLRYLVVGTESTLDHSKPVASYVQGMLRTSKIGLPDNMSTFQVQHACAGGTIGALSVAALLKASPHVQESGVVICSDIARYDAPSSAEPTQGAGAVSLLIEKNPRLIELDIATPGYASHDVDDFFRPLGSETARVKGGYSIQCYNEALESAFLDHCRRIGDEPATVLKSCDLIVFHVPFYEMAVIAAHKLISRHLGVNGPALSDFLCERGFPDSLAPVASIGNIYTGSAYLSLAFLLAERYRTLGEAIVGKRLLLASYGSGNTMVVLSGRVAPSAPEVISRWDLDAVWREQRKAEWGEYLQWVGALASPGKQCPPDGVPGNRFYLSNIREDGYREYEFQER